MISDNALMMTRCFDLGITKHRQSKMAASSTGHEENIPSADPLTECCNDLGIPKRTLTLMADEKRNEIKKQIVERTKELVAERFGQDSVRLSRGNTANVADAEPNGAA